MPPSPARADLLYAISQAAGCLVGKTVRFGGAQAVGSCWKHLGPRVRKEGNMCLGVRTQVNTGASDTINIPMTRAVVLQQVQTTKWPLGATSAKKSTKGWTLKLLGPRFPT